MRGAAAAGAGQLGAGYRPCPHEHSYQPVGTHYRSRPHERAPPAPGHDRRRAAHRAIMALMGQVVALDSLVPACGCRPVPSPLAGCPFATLAGLDRSWHPPEPGEQVLLVAPGGDLNQGWWLARSTAASIRSGRFSRRFCAPGSGRAVMEYDRAQHHWRLAVPAGGRSCWRLALTTLELRDQGALTTPLDAETSRQCRREHLHRPRCC